MLYLHNNYFLSEDSNNVTRLYGKVSLDYTKKVFFIEGINFKKFFKRLDNICKTKKLRNLFDYQYSELSEQLYKAEVISKKQMRIVRLEVPLFFALEFYNLFKIMGEYYENEYYKNVAKNIYEKTWISNFETKKQIETDTTNLKNFNIIPKDYQLEFIKKYENFKQMYDLEGYILSFEQGLGKTFTAIAISECIKNIDQVIIVCPNSLKEVWASEIQNYFKKYITNPNLVKNDVYAYNVSGYSFNQYTRFIIVNNESIAKIYSLCKKRNVMIIVDESHNFRNIEAKSVKELLKLKEITNCKDNLLMSGTPLKATPDELIPALRMIDPYFTPDLAVRYKKAFSISDSTISRIVKDRFSRTIYRKTKDEVLQLPNKEIIEKYYRIPNEKDYYIDTVQSEVNSEYIKIYKDKLEELDEMSKEFEYLIRKYSSASKQLTSDYLDFINLKTDPTKETGYVHEYRQSIYNDFLEVYVYPNVDNPSDLEEIKRLKTKYINMSRSAIGIALGEILPPARTQCYIDIYTNNRSQIFDLIEDHLKKTVIFTPFLGVARFLANDLYKNGIANVLITGETKDRMSLINKFRQSEECDVLVATTQTLSTGVTLTEADRMIFFGTPYRSADFNQACDRIHRIGQTSDVFIYIVMLESKEYNITQRINDILNWSDEMFNELIDNETSIISNEKSLIGMQNISAYDKIKDFIKHIWKK